MRFFLALSCLITFITIGACGGPTGEQANLAAVSDFSVTMPTSVVAKATSLKVDFTIQNDDAIHNYDCTYLVKKGGSYREFLGTDFKTPTGRNRTCRLSPFLRSPEGEVYLSLKFLTNKEERFLIPINFVDPSDRGFFPHGDVTIHKNNFKKVRGASNTYLASTSLSHDKVEVVGSVKISHDTYIITTQPNVLDEHVIIDGDLKDIKTISSSFKFGHNSDFGIVVPGVGPVYELYNNYSRDQISCETFANKRHRCRLQGINVFHSNRRTIGPVTEISNEFSHYLGVYNWFDEKHEQYNSQLRDLNTPGQPNYRLLTRSEVIKVNDFRCDAQPVRVDENSITISILPGTTPQQLTKPVINAKFSLIATGDIDTHEGIDIRFESEHPAGCDTNAGNFYCLQNHLRDIGTCTRLPNGSNKWYCEKKFSLPLAKAKRGNPRIRFWILDRCGGSQDIYKRFSDFPVLENRKLEFDPDIIFNSSIETEISGR